MVRRKPTLSQAEPGSLDELVALRAIAVRQLGEATPREASPLISKVQDLGGKIRDLREASERETREAHALESDEAFNPETV